MNRSFLLLYLTFMIAGYNSYSQCNEAFFINPFLNYSPLFPMPSGFQFSDGKPAFIDIDNDGDMDAFIGEANGNVHYFKNTATSTSPVFSLQTGSSNPFNGIDVGSDSSPAFTDIDSDGDFDAFVGEMDGSVNFYKNTGTSANAIFNLQNGNNNPFNGIDVGWNSTPCFADIDNDGDTDAFVGELDGNINYYKNTGTSANAIFSLQSGNNNPLDSVSVGKYSTPSLIDIDKDGDMDAFIGEYEGGVFYYTNTGNSSLATFVSQVSSNNPLAWVDVGAESAPCFIDIDNDSDMDAFIGQDSWSKINYYKNTGSSISAEYTLQTFSNNPLEWVNVGYYSTPSFVDIDNDGDNDVFVGEHDGNINYYKNTGTLTNPLFSLQIESYNPFNGEDVGMFSAPTFTDIDEDGDWDAFIGESQGTILYYKNVGSLTNPVFSLQTGNNNPLDGIDVGSNSAPNFIDIDNDGDMDIFIGEYEGNINYYKNTGTSTNAVFSLQNGNNNPFDGADVGYYATPSFADLDGDDDCDALVGEYEGNIYYYKNTGNKTNAAFTLQTPSNTPLEGLNVGNAVPSFVDINNDGDFDVFAGDYNGKIYYYENVGNSIICAFSNPLNGQKDIGWYSKPAFADIDNDGDMDAFIGETDGIIHYYKNTGSKTIPSFTLQTLNNNPFDSVDVGSHSAPFLLDIDNDGDLDAFIGEANGTIYYYKNVGSAINPVFSLQIGSNNPLKGIDVGQLSMPAFVDIDNDGDYDIFVGESNGTIYYYKNTGSNTNPVFNLQTSTANPFDGIDVGYYSAPAFADIDHDGDMDAFVGENLGSIKYYKNTGTSINATFSLQSGSSNPFDGLIVGQVSAPCFVDIDDDGDMDAFVGEFDGYYNGYINHYLNNEIIFNNVIATDSQICKGNEVTIKASFIYNTTWSNGISNGLPFIPDSSHTYSVIADNGKGCIDTISINIVVHELPALTASITNETNNNNGAIDLIVSGGLSPYQYDWDNDGSGDNDDTEDLSNLSADTYGVFVTDANGCVDTLAVTIEKQTIANIMEMNTDLLFIYPNPAKENFTIQLNGNIEPNTQLQIFDALGKRIYSQKITETITTINSSKFNKGLYLLKMVNGNNESIMQKIIIE